MHVVKPYKAKAQNKWQIIKPNNNTSLRLIKINQYNDTSRAI